VILLVRLTLELNGMVKGIVLVRIGSRVANIWISG